MPSLRSFLFLNHQKSREKIEKSNCSDKEVANV